MSKTAPALINGDVLIWARETIGYTPQEASEKIGIAPERVIEWESGHLFPSIAQLKTISRVYKRPFSTFYLPERPADIKRPRDFRRIHAASDFKDVAELNIAIQAVEFRREASIELVGAIGESVSGFSQKLNSKTEPDVAGALIRKVLGVTFDQQRKWRDPRVGLNAWRGILEKSGILVAQFSGVNLEEARGFSISEVPLPAVAINSQDAPAGRIFTLLHEVVHVMLRQSSTCDIVEEYKRTPEAQRVEVYCNAVAGNALVPSSELKTFLQQVPVNSVPLDETLKNLAREFSVSRGVILRRLHTLGEISQSTFDRKHRELLDEYERIRRELALRNKGKKIIITPTRRLLANAGTKYVSLVMDALNKKKISLSDIPDYLGVKLRHLPKIKTELERRWANPGVDE